MRAVDVAILEDFDDLRDMLELVLADALGVRCLGVGSLSELQAHRGEVLSSRLILIDVNLGEGRASGVDAHAWLLSQGFRGVVLYLTGHANSHPLVERARAMGTTVLSKPIRSEALVAVVSDLMENRSREA